MATATKKTAQEELAEVRQLAQELAADGIARKTTVNTPDPAAVLGTGPSTAPHIRKGENPLSSRGYSIGRVIKAKLNMDGLSDPWQEAKVEQALHTKFKTAFGAGVGSATFEGGTLAPFASEFLPEGMGESKSFAAEVRSLMYAGVENADPEEISRLSKDYGQHRTKTAAAQGWLDQTLGGSLVGPPQFGEPIELWRNQDALVRAGATVGPMPPTGRFVAPRQTNASTGYWLGEGQSGTGTNIKVGQITWTAKKLIGLLVYNREILQFGGAAAEMLFRMDLARTLVLTADQAFLEGNSPEIKPLGIINTPNIATVTPTTAASGNTGALLAPQDVEEFPLQVEENNIPDEAGCSFIMRPSLYYKLLKRRVDAVSAADAAGLFAFSPLRNLNDSLNVKSINGRRVVTTTQVSQSRVQGSTTNLTYMLYGYWPDYLILMSPMIEFVVASQGNPTGLGDLFQQDQFCLKSGLFVDGAARHPGGFAFCDKLQIA